MNESPNNSDQADGNFKVGSVRSAARRRLLQAGISAAPVAMTVLSKPVLATTNPPGFCQSPSGFVSGNVSQGNRGACAGRTPGYWKQQQHFGDWRAPYYPTTVTGPGAHTATNFSAVFSPDLKAPPWSFASPADPGYWTFLCVMEPQCNLQDSNGPPWDVARHIVAAVLNNAAGYVPETILPLQTIKDIWKYYSTEGCYKPTNSSLPCWDHTQVVQYLTSTMD